MARIIAVLMLLWAVPASAEPIEVTGRIVDALGKPIAGASVTIGDLTVKTGRDGRYHAEVDENSSIVVDKDGYDTALGTATGPTIDDIVLLRPSAGETIEVHGDPPPSSPGATTLGRVDAERLPGTGGGDLVRTLTAMPGVLNAQLPTGFSGIVIRGSAPQDSKILIDDFEVPILYHTIAFRAIVPTEAIDSLEYVPGGFDVAFGRAGSGIVSLKTRTGTDSRSEQAELSVLDGGVLAQGAIDKTTHYMLAFRRSTIDLILPYLIPSSANLSLTTVPNYYDLQGKIDHQTGDWKLSASTIGSIDAFEIYGDKMQSPDKRFSVETEFIRGTLAARWHRNKWNVVLEGSEMAQKNELIFGLTQHLVVDRLESTARAEATYTDSEAGFHDLEWRTGAEADVSHYDLNFLIPAPMHNGIVAGMRPGENDNTIAFTGAVWTPDFAAWTALTLGLASNIHLTTGLRVDGFARTNDAVVEPRGQLVVDLSDKVKARIAAGSYRRPAEYQDELTHMLHPESADQAIAGVEINPREGIKIQPSLYYTARTDLVASDANGVLGNQGRGTTYGAELLVTAHGGPWFGWLSYSYSRSTRIDYPGAAQRDFEYDQPHTLNAALSWHKGAWTLGGRFELYSGLPYTPVTGSVFNSDTNHYAAIYGAADSERAPLHHQLDIRIDHVWQVGPVALTGFIDVQNVYLNDSITRYQFSFDFSQNAPIKSLPIIPSIGVRGVPVKWLALLGFLVACSNNFDERWQLANDRVIAVRLTPSTLAAGETGTIDAYVTTIAEGPGVLSPTTVQSTALDVAGDQVTAPDAATLASLRTQAGLAGDALVGLPIATVFTISGTQYAATRTVYCGTHGDNPSFGAVTIAGTAPSNPITVPLDTDVQLAIDEASTVLVNWYSSVGTLDDDDDEHLAKLHVKPDDPMTGKLAVVIRDAVGGVALESWAVQTAP